MNENNAIRLITEGFDAHGIKYQIHETEEYREIHVFFGIQNGPTADVRYISRNQGNDILVRVMNLINKAPDEKRYRIMEACNKLNCQYRFLKFNLDAENNVDAEYDLPASTGDACLGEMAFEILARTIQILNAGYPQLAKILYASDENEPGVKIESNGTRDFLKLLKDKHDEINIKISKNEPAENQES